MEATMFGGKRVKNSKFWIWKGSVLCLCISALCGSVVEFLTVSSLIYLMILLVYCRANLAPTHVPMIWQKQLLTDILNMLLCQIDYQNNYSQSIFSFKFATFVSCWRKVCVNTKAALFFHIVTENMLFHHIWYFIHWSVLFLSVKRLTSF